MPACKPGPQHAQRADGAHSLSWWAAWRQPSPPVPGWQLTSAVARAWAPAVGFVQMAWVSPCEEGMHGRWATRANRPRAALQSFQSATWHRCRASTPTWAKASAEACAVAPPLALASAAACATACPRPCGSRRRGAVAAAAGRGRAPGGWLMGGGERPPATCFLATHLSDCLCRGLSQRLALACRQRGAQLAGLDHASGTAGSWGMLALRLHVGSLDSHPEPALSRRPAQRRLRCPIRRPEQRPGRWRRRRTAAACGGLQGQGRKGRRCVSGVSIRPCIRGGGTGGRLPRRASRAMRAAAARSVPPCASRRGSGRALEGRSAADGEGIRARFSGAMAVPAGPARAQRDQALASAWQQAVARLTSSRVALQGGRQEQQDQAGALHPCDGVDAA